MHTPLPSTTVRFFKIITKIMLEDGKLRIPDGFTRKCGADLSNPVFFKTPDGRKSKINWTKIDGDIMFENGWKEFATYYSLNHGHLVLFEYDERTSSHFGVHIFDKSTLEIEYAFHGNQYEHNNSGQIIVAKCKKSRPKSPMPCPELQKKKLRSNTSEDVATCSKMQNIPTDETFDETPQSKKTKGKSPMSCPQPHKKLKTEESEDGGDNSNLQNFPKDDMGGNKEYQKVKMEFELLNSRIAEALQKAKNYKSNYPTFMVIMISTFVDQYLYVPSKFAKQHLKERQSDIFLQVLDDRSWLVRYHLGRIDVGWTTFAYDNNVKVGDVCVFELTKSQPLTLKVLIYQSGEEPHFPPTQVQGDGVNQIDPNKLSDAESKTISSREESKKTRKNSPEANPLSFTNEANPFFMITINTKRPVQRVPCNFTDMYLKPKKQIVMLKVEEKKWHVMLLCYPYKTPSILSAGWSSFVQENKLKTGDVCVFELTNREDVEFDIHVLRSHS